jgi:hypothetical protein
MVHVRNEGKDSGKETFFPVLYQVPDLEDVCGMEV